MNCLHLMGINWEGIASVPKETFLIACGTVVVLAVIVAIVLIIKT